MKECSQYRATRKPEARPTEHRLAGLQGNPLVEPTRGSGSANEPLVGEMSVTTGYPLEIAYSSPMNYL